VVLDDHGAFERRLDAANLPRGVAVLRAISLPARTPSKGSRRASCGSDRRWRCAGSGCEVDRADVPKEVNSVRGYAVGDTATARVSDELA